MDLFWSFYVRFQCMRITSKNECPSFPFFASKGVRKKSVINVVRISFKPCEDNMDESSNVPTELDEERWFALLAEGQHLQEKIAQLLKRWHLGVGWTVQMQQDLSSLMYQ